MSGSKEYYEPPEVDIYADYYGATGDEAEDWSTALAAVAANPELGEDYRVSCKHRPADWPGYARDDLNGSLANTEVLFSLDGEDYEIDLTDAHAAELREKLAPFIAVARVVRDECARAMGQQPDA